MFISEKNRNQVSVTRQKAFTLIELLVVLAIIGVLAAILFPVFARARENARRASCASNLKQIGLAMYMYSQDYDEHLVPQQIQVLNSAGSTITNYWNNLLIPYVKSDQVYVCPSTSQVSIAGRLPLTNYGYNRAGQPTVALVEGNNANLAIGGTYTLTGVTGAPTVLTLAAVPDPSGTIAIGDAVTWNSAGANGIAYYGNGSPFVIWTNVNPISGTTNYYPDPRHLDGANFVFLDGHAKWEKTPVASTMFSVNQD